MNKLKCTPGNWEIQNQQLVAENGKTVAVFVDCGSQEENEANARLLAASMQLYRAVSKARDTMASKVFLGGLMEHEMEAMKVCDKALLKVWGEL